MFESERLPLPLGEQPPCRRLSSEEPRLLREDGGGALGVSPGRSIPSSHSLGFLRTDGVDSVKVLRTQEDGGDDGGI